MSKLGKLNDNAIKQLMSLISKDFNDEDLSVNMINIADNQNIVDSALSYFGISSPDLEDYTYVCELFVLNQNFETPPIQRPEMKSIVVTHSEDYNEYGTRYYEQTIDTYTMLDNDDLYALSSNEFYNYWEGENTVNDVHDTEVSSNSIEEIRLLKRF
jgi:hypothetical protein